jgi:cytoskeletal protein CcmA (bactofilin family)
VKTGALRARVALQPEEEWMATEVTATPDERRTTAWIGKALRVEGRIVSQENLTIDGEIDGTIEVGDHNLMIGAGAQVKADLTAKTITISGAVTGNVLATDKVHLQATGSVDGDITTPRLIMADGAVIKGRVDARGEKPKD